VADRQFGPYKLVRQIAVGGMAEIHLAKTAGIAGFEKYVALKMIHPNFAEDEQFIQMLVDEAKIAVQLTHGNIAQTFDLGRVGETYYITMEYVDGADLYKILRRASEQDLDMPLDVCAFVGKEISSALDHAHRKRDHAGKSLGIVHRDVSPQNVLVSYSGEVKLVDFGIAKATMKVRQTAVGVIKGKYYYMSPEQAWGDPIDHRSDIFSAGIVLYEMITGQMLYLEEDLHKLLDMARRADIAPPSKLRKGVPPQLERIVMHALAKVPGERYQSAGDLATDLERFLHAYSPVFTASKLSGLMRQVIGEPIQVPDDKAFQSIEFRDGVMSTHPLDDSEVARAADRDDLRDSNSVIFRLAALAADELPAPPLLDDDDLEEDFEDDLENATTLAPPEPVRKPAPAPVQVPRDLKPTAPSRPLGKPGAAPRETRATDSLPAVPRASAAIRVPAVVPSVPRSIPSVVKPPPRQAHEDTRKLDTPAPANPLQEDSGLLTPDGKKLWDEVATDAGHEDDLENIGERTLVTALPGMSTGNGFSGFMMDASDDDGPVEATLVTQAPPGFGGVEEAEEPPPRPAARKKEPPPAALQAKIHAPAVSELRKPRASRKTPPSGSPTTQPSVLAAIMSSQSSEPMPAPRPQPPQPPAAPPPQPAAALPPPPYAMPSQMAAQASAAMATQHGDPYAPHPGASAQGPAGYPASAQFPSAQYDASGLPLGIPTPPSGVPAAPGVPAHLQPYLHMQGMPPGYGPEGQAGYPQLSPGALYHFQPPPPQAQALSLTGQMRLMEIDEIPSMYKLGAARRRWFTYIVSGILAVSVAAAVTFLIIRSTRESAPTTGSVHIESVPPGADVLYDGTRLSDKTPLTIDMAPVGTRHTIRLELARHQAWEDTAVDIAKDGRTVSISATLEPLTGKLLVNSVPAGADIYINGQIRGRTPTTLNGVDMDSAKRLELRLKDYQPYQRDLQWPADGKISVDVKLAH
jgi:serine/threonine protein kinase